MKILLLLVLVSSAAPAFAQDRGLRKYGDVAFADSLHQKYPIDTREHIRAAWAYLHRRKNVEKYSKEELEQVKNRIRAAAKRNGIHLKN